MKNDQRGPWYLLTGLVLGVISGLVISWVFLPVNYVDTAPDTLREDFKDAYRSLIAVAYLSSGNVERAKVRLRTLDQEDSTDLYQTLTVLAGDDRRTESERQALNILAAALTGQEMPVSNATPEISAEPTQSVATLSPTPLLVQTEPVSADASSATPELETPRPRSTITRTPTLLPSRTPTLTPGAAFVLESKEQVCDLNIGEALIEVEVFDASRQPVPGIEILVSWEGGDDYFFTGIKPEFNLGYADFVMTPGILYQLHLASGGEPVTDLTSLECEGESGRFWGGWHLLFIQP